MSNAGLRKKRKKRQKRQKRRARGRAALSVTLSLASMSACVRAAVCVLSDVISWSSARCRRSSSAFSFCSSTTSTFSSSTLLQAAAGALQPLQLLPHGPQLRLPLALHVPLQLHRALQARLAVPQLVRRVLLLRLLLLQSLSDVAVEALELKGAEGRPVVALHLQEVRLDPVESLTLPPGSLQLLLALRQPALLLPHGPLVVLRLHQALYLLHAVPGGLQLGLLGGHGGSDLLRLVAQLHLAELHRLALLQAQLAHRVQSLDKMTLFSTAFDTPRAEIISRSRSPHFDDRLTFSPSLGERQRKGHHDMERWIVTFSLFTSTCDEQPLPSACSSQLRVDGGGAGGAGGSEAPFTAAGRPSDASRDESPASTQRTETAALMCV
ncbi:hypothetical protein EYF80_056178 [Liparis tanakae]|uniref:Uncharacterized protein n=1 Tax=Liparis tanakae TaxID=230148 RepID=A0A4Z2EXU4_9TELE|nr:hypothetical protein EYF80_056178 [Liparis tanakae]